MPRSGSSDSASAHSRATTAFSPGKPSMPNTRHSTRLTLPSRIATRSPQAKAAIAAAVERPMPGSPAIAAALCGNAPPCSSMITRAARCRLRARA